jgi:alcohol dehydrogenase class IV|tara:strand:+ start:1407 stop:2714 length:1308 start_codon:yes stop_codon:yes gene_type:complete
LTCCHHYQLSPGGDLLFAVDVSRLRYGVGAMNELGEEARLLGLKRLAIYTDARIAQLPLFSEAMGALHSAGLQAVIYDRVRVEPTDASFREAIQFAVDDEFDGFISVGGGSVMDTCKAANLYSTYPADFMDYVNAPIGQGRPVPGTLKPHLACPTTAGTGSECTGIAVFDLLQLESKTGIMARPMLPDRAIVDPRWTDTLPSSVMAATGFDAISHALEALTAKPYCQRLAPQDASVRPMTQGANPWSDMLCREALRQCGQYLVRAVNDDNDKQARHGMMYAATVAGIAFGNAGCHLPHAMSYPVSARVQDFSPEGYPGDESICPHGMSVIVNAPAAYRFTASGCPDRHLEGAGLLGADTREVVAADSGEILAQQLQQMMCATDMPNGIGGVGFTSSQVPGLAQAAALQQRLLSVAPRPVSDQDLHDLYHDALSYW